MAKKFADKVDECKHDANAILRLLVSEMRGARFFLHSVASQLREKVGDTPWCEGLTETASILEYSELVVDNIIVMREHDESTVQ
jgi:hypothetical protein